MSSSSERQRANNFGLKYFMSSSSSLSSFSSSSHAWAEPRRKHVLRDCGWVDGSEGGPFFPDAADPPRSPRTPSRSTLGPCSGLLVAAHRIRRCLADHL